MSSFGSQITLKTDLSCLILNFSFLESRDLGTNRGWYLYKYNLRKVSGNCQLESFWLHRLDDISGV
jgi:hypothetical protein